MEYSFKTLNYLGCKLRLLDFIEGNLHRMVPDEAPVCDLFAGSGCVSYRLSRGYAVTSCDIQHYSQVLCRALMEDVGVTDRMIEAFFGNLDWSLQKRLMTLFRPLITVEESAIRNRDLNELTEVIEHGSVEVFDIEGGDSSLAERLRRVGSDVREEGLDGVKSLVSRYYGGVYFSYRQAVQLDVLLDAIFSRVEKRQRDLFLAALLSTASEVVDTVGKHFAQPIKARDPNGMVKPLVYTKAVKDKTLDVFTLYREWLRKYLALPRSGKPCHVVQCDYLECLRSLPSSVKTVYADPPYTREHYSRFYHVLETMSLRDVPVLSTVTVNGAIRVSNGIYRQGRHQSPFCIRTKAPNAFMKMMEVAAAGGRNLLLSYSPYDSSKRTHPRVVTIEQIRTWAEECYKRVEVVSAGMFHHSKLNSTKHQLDASDEAEMLIVCEKAR